MKKKDSTQIVDYNLIRKIAWSFAKHSKEPFDDLFQEGYIGYMHAQKTYTPSKGAFSTYAWWCISAKIKDYLITMNRKNQLLQMWDDLSYLNKATPTYDFLDNLPFESLEIVKIILAGPTPFIVRSPEKAKERLITILIENQGWSLDKVMFGLNYLYKICNLIN